MLSNGTTREDQQQLRVLKMALHFLFNDIIQYDIQYLLQKIDGVNRLLLQYCQILVNSTAELQLCFSTFRINACFYHDL